MILETAVNTTRQSRNRTQTSFNAEDAEQCGGEEHFLSPFSAFLSESLRLCVNCSPPASKSGYSSTKNARKGTWERDGLHPPGGRARLPNPLVLFGFSELQ